MSSARDLAAAPGLSQIADVLAAGGDRLADLLERAEARLVEVVDGYGAALVGHVGDTLAAGGKRLRPMLVFIAAGDAAGEELVSAGVAVELLHMATLVHDDVLDSAQLRRGRPTVYASGGRTAATATGDLLFSRAFSVLAATGRPDAARALSDASSALARGELLQREDAWSQDLVAERYIERCRLKTAELFAAACRLGALLGDPGAAAAGALAAFGERIGLAFQIFDDVLDVAGPAERTGKARGMDLLDGTVTLPLILARRHDPRLAALDIRRAVTTPEAAMEVCDRIAGTGALDEAREVALTYVAAAKERLGTVTGLGERQRSLLVLVADGVVERYA
ncbi:MAG: polyprenyl synthetase family protein [Actinobacteria bacterium]|nr:polyprenyl synthetase family protein [Actinomycetota bacterium]